MDITAATIDGTGASSFCLDFEQASRYIPARLSKHRIIRANTTHPRGKPNTDSTALDKGYVGAQGPTE